MKHTNHHKKYRWRLKLLDLCLLQWLLSFVSVVEIIDAQSLPSAEMQALQDLYYSTGGPYWRWLPSSQFGYPWDFTSNGNPCSAVTPWQGITCSSTCDKTACHVVALIITAKNLTGKRQFLAILPTIINVTLTNRPTTN
jgi:hypothetical protein